MFRKIILLSMILYAVVCNSKVLNLSSKELISAQAGGVVVIDIRTPHEWDETGTIKGAHKIMFFDQNRKPLINEFLTSFKRLVTKKEQPFILVCRSGSRTGVVTQFLDEKLGYLHGAHLQHGIKQWIKEKYETEKK